MARYRGPRCKLLRREGVDFGLTSGIRPIQSKCKLETPPGQFGQRRGRLSDYGLQLRMKQLIRRYYGVLERQFRRTYGNASKQKGSTALNLFRQLEARLDNSIFRMGFASTRSEARQLISHKGVMVNGKVTNIASYTLKPGDQLALTEAAKQQLRVKAALELAQQRPESSWLNVDNKAMSAEFVSYPAESDMPPEFKFNLVIELYSK